MPVSAVIWGGNFNVSKGSSTAKCGIIDISITGNFSFVSLFVNTAANVASAPVPAVVGTTNNGGKLFKTLNNPFIFSTFLRGFTIRAPVIFAQSIGDPPPKAIIPSQLLFSYKLTASSILLIVG